MTTCDRVFLKIQYFLSGLTLMLKVMIASMLMLTIVITAIQRFVHLNVVDQFSV